MKEKFSLSRLLSFIRSDEGISLATLFALAVMMFATGIVFYLAGTNGTEYWLLTALIGIISFLFALALDYAVLIFTLRGKPWYKIYPFTVFQIVMNLTHFIDINGKTEVPWKEGFGSLSLSQWFISFSLPLAIALFSKEIELSRRGNRVSMESGTLEAIRLQELESTLIKLSSTIDDLSERVLTHNLENIEAHLGILRDFMDAEIKKGDTTVSLFEDVLSKLNRLESEYQAVKKAVNANTQTFLHFKGQGTPGTASYIKVGNEHLL